MSLLSATMKSTLIGLTGGIASGKSTVTTILREKGYLVIDADQLVHDLQKQGGHLYQALVEAFGDEILLPSGELDRQKLAQLIFSSPFHQEKSARLQDRIIRQALWDEKERALKEHSLVFMDIPLLFEKDFGEWFDVIWLVYVDHESQVKRLMKRNGFSKEEALKRLSFQMPLEDKKVLADEVIDNRGDLVQLENQVKALLLQLLERKKD